MIESYKKLIVWEKAIELVENIYKLTAEFPKDETYGLSSQMKRAAVSIPSNIAEGYKRKGLGEYLHFLSIADGSAAELETQLLIAEKLFTKINFKKALAILEEIQKMLYALIKKLNPKPYTLNPNQRGVAVLFAVLLIGIFLSITLTLSAIFIPKIRISSDVKNSVGAIYAAESGVEWCLYVNRIGAASQPIMSNGASYINGNTGNPFLTPSPVPGECVSPIKSTGTYNGVTRSLEISF